MGSACSPFRRHPPDAPHDRFPTLPLSVVDFHVVSASRCHCLFHLVALRGRSGLTPTAVTDSPWSGLRHLLAGSPPHPAVSRSSSYGLVIHLLLLPTPPHGDAVTIGYRPESACLTGTFTPLTKPTLGRTSTGPCGLCLGRGRPANRGWPTASAVQGVRGTGHKGPCYVHVRRT